MNGLTNSAPRRRQAQLVPTLQVANLSLMALLTWVTLRWAAPSVQMTLFQLWVIAALMALALAPSFRDRREVLRPSALSPLAPLLAFLLTLCLFATLHLGGVALKLLPVFGLWLLLQFLITRYSLRGGAPLRLGVLGTAPADLLPFLEAARIQTVPIGTQPVGALAAVDLLLVQLEQPSLLQHRVLEHAQAMNTPVLTSWALREELTHRVALGELDESWLTKTAFQSDYLLWKRFFDVFFTLLSLPVLLPLMAVVALVVLFNSGRPILFWQERVGKDGVPFQLVKFRTMTRDSERSGPAFAQQGDMRVTPVGAFLRKFRLDELPQFWNVLRGEMSIIGPRPEQWAFASEFEESIPLYRVRHWVRPGITGWAQVTQGYAAGESETAQKLSYDFYYVKYLSLTTDLQIVWKTILTILTGFGAR